MARSVPPGPAVSGGDGKSEDRPVRAFRSSGAWEAWLAEHHASSDGLWLKFGKKDSGVASVTHAEALGAALCWGGIDGGARSFDKRYWLQRFTPRTSRSKWSKVNCEKASALIDAGLMKPAGLRPEPRARRIATYVHMLSEHNKIYP